ncbi:MAG: T9SS type A sorting domain-containing protein [Bacteroidales bacterium]
MRTFLSVLMMVACVIVAAGQTIPFTESFENGLAKWNNLSTGGTVEASTVDAIIGEKSLHITGNGVGEGLSLDFAASQNLSVLFYYVKVVGGDGGVVAAGNGHSAINAAFYGEITGGNFVVTGSTGTTNLGPVVSNEWLRVEVKNMNFTDMTYDVYLNGVLKGNGLPFRGSVSSISTLDVYNQTAGAEAWWDGIYAGVSNFDYPAFEDTKICANVVDEISVSPAVVLDSAGFYKDSTWFQVGPFAADEMVEYRYPFIESNWIGNNNYDLAWGGNMFDVVAAKDIVIDGFDLNLGTTTAASAKVYYRSGSYVGFESSNVGWILLDSVNLIQNGVDYHARLDLTKSLTIAEGQTMGLYICTSVGIYYTTGNGTNETIVNDDMTCHFGNGGAFFSVIYSPRVWNGRIYYKVAEEHKEDKSITSIFASNNQYNGNMFDVFAKNDIVIDSLDVNIISDGWVKLYVRNGTVVGNNTSNAGWSLVDSVVVVASGQDIPTRVPLSNRILLRAGNLYGLYVCSVSDMRYTGIIAGTNDVYTDSNMVLTGHYGGSNAFFCSSSRIWNGTLYYSVRNVDTVDVSTQTSTSTYGSLLARGFYYVAPNDHVITGLRVPNEAAGTQYIEVVRFNNIPPSYSVTTNEFVSLGRHTNVAGNAIVPVNAFIHKGDIIGVLGTRYSGTVTTMSWTANPTYPTTILGDSVTLYRMGTQADFVNNPAQNLWTENSNWVGRVEMFVEPVTIHGGPDSVLMDVQTPAPDLGADGEFCVQNTVTLDPGTFSSYDWSTSETTATIDVDTTGAPLNTPFDVWVTVTDQYGCTGSDTITITFIDCTGIDENDITLSIYPNPSDGVFYLRADNVQDEMLVQVFSLDGRIVKEVVLNDTFGSIDMSNELPGVYSIRITIKDQVKEMRVVLQ